MNTEGAFAEFCSCHGSHIPAALHSSFMSRVQKRLQRIHLHSYCSSLLSPPDAFWDLRHLPRESAGILWGWRREDMRRQKLEKLEYPLYAYLRPSALVGAFFFCVFVWTKIFCGGQNFLKQDMPRKTSINICRQYLCDLVWKENR